MWRDRGSVLGVGDQGGRRGSRVEVEGMET